MTDLEALAEQVRHDAAEFAGQAFTHMAVAEHLDRLATAVAILARTLHGMDMAILDLKGDLAFALRVRDMRGGS